MKRKVDAYVNCPYYHSEDRQVIFCEGVEENTQIHVAFSSITQKRAYEQEMCRNEWGRCLWADALNRKWDDK